MKIFFPEIKKYIKSILEVSNIIIERNGIECNKLLNISSVETLDDEDLINIKELINNVKITYENFNLPLLQESSFSILFNEILGNCILERKHKFVSLVCFQHFFCLQFAKLYINCIKEIYILIK